jgi:hypothetical protein
MGDYPFGDFAQLFGTRFAPAGGNVADLRTPALSPARFNSRHLAEKRQSREKRSRSIDDDRGTTWVDRDGSHRDPSGDWKS